MGNVQAQKLKIGEVADYLGITRHTLRRWDKSGKLKAQVNPITKHRYYLRKDIIEFGKKYGITINKEINHE